MTRRRSPRQTSACSASGQEVLEREAGGFGEHLDVAHAARRGDWPPRRGRVIERALVVAETKDRRRRGSDTTSTTSSSPPTLKRAPHRRSAPSSVLESAASGWRKPDAGVMCEFAQSARSGDVGDDVVAAGKVVRHGLEGVVGDAEQHQVGRSDVRRAHRGGR